MTSKQKEQEVHQWLEFLFGVGKVPRFEPTDGILTDLEKLMDINIMYPTLRPYTCTYMHFDCNSQQHASVSFYVAPADFRKFASQASQWKAQFKKN